MKLNPRINRSVVTVTVELNKVQARILAFVLDNHLMQYDTKGTKEEIELLSELEEIVMMFEEK